MTLAVVGVVGTLPSCISSRDSRAHDRRLSRIFQSTSLIVHS